MVLNASAPNSVNKIGLFISFLTFAKASPKETPRYILVPKMSMSGHSVLMMSKNNKSPLQIAIGCEASICFISKTASLKSLYNECALTVDFRSSNGMFSVSAPSQKRP